MTKKLLFSLLLACCVFVTGVAQTQEALEHVLGQGGTTTTAAQASAGGKLSAQEARSLQAKLKEALEPARKAVPEAECKQVSAAAEPLLQQLEGTCSEGTLTATAAKPQRAPRQKANTLPDSLYAAEFDYAYKDGSESISGIVKIKLTGSTTAVVYNLWGLTDTLQATFDATAGTVSITPGQVYNHSTYGPIWVCSYDGSSYSSTTPITGTIAADGTITLGGWGVFVYSGTYKGGYFGTYSKSVFKPTNATVTDVLYDGSSVTNTDSTLTYPIYIEQTHDNQARIINFGNCGADVKIRLKSDNSVYMSPQRMFYNSYYGYLGCYSADWATSKKAQSGNIVGTGTSTEITLGNWGIFVETSTSTRARAVLSTTITFAQGTITYPQATSQDWTGSGTEASPYVITTPTQLVAFGDEVNGGNAFKGKYVKLGNDLDMSGLTLAVSSIGTAECPFNGNFSGDGHTIKNFTLEAGSVSYQGLFGYADSASVITNLTLDAAKVTSNGRYSAGIVGYSAGVITDIKVTNSTFDLTNYSCSAVVGRFAGSTLKNISAQATVTAGGDFGMAVGQLAAGAQASNLHAHGSIKVTSLYSSYNNAFGGVAGSILWAKGVVPTLTDSYSDVQMSSTVSEAYVGGVVGQMLGGVLERCYSNGNVSGASLYSMGGTVGGTGGIVGECYGGTLRNCYNSNMVMNTSYTTRLGGITGVVPTPSYTMNSSGDTVAVNYKSSISNCLNVGQVYMGTMLETQGVYGEIYSDSIFHNVYFDQQMVGNIMPSATAWMTKTTRELTSGEALSGFDASVWNFTQGLYPRLKGLESSNAAYLGAAPITLNGSETVINTKTDFKVSTSNDIYWKILQSSAYVDESTGLAISGDSVVVKNAYSTTILAGLSKNDASLLKLVAVRTINPAAFTGEGTEDNPYLIKTKADLISINTGLAGYGQTFRGSYFKQCNDIDIEGATDFQGIGTGGKTAVAFDATYDGGGYAIHNLKVHGVVNGDDGKAVESKSLYLLGLFGYVGEHATIKNVTIASDCEFEAFDYAAGVAGVNYGTIKNCKNYASVSTVKQYSAGITTLSDAMGRVEGCYNAGRIVTGGSYAAGIVAYARGVITGNQNDGVILGDSINPYNTSSDSQNSIAGIAAYNASASELTNNVNTGAIFGGYKVGGIASSLSTMGTAFSGNISYGTVDHKRASDAYRGAMLASTPGKSSDLHDNYYDSQVLYFGAAASNACNGLNGVNTSVLTSGKALEGLDADLYDWTAGYYPVLKAFKDEPAAIAHRKMVVTFADAQNANDILTDATLQQSDDLSWKLTSGKYFSITGNALKINMTDELISFRDTLVATVGDYTKTIDLRGMPKVFDGAGTASDPFQIKTKDDMLKLATFTNVELYPFSGRYFRVMNDIDFDTTTYVPVGVDAGSFNADFDGNGKKFFNIVNVLAATTDASRGLFGNVGPEGVIHDLTLASGTLTSYRYAGSIAGNVYGKLVNCENHAAVTTTKSSGAGGIAGTVKQGGSVVRCRNYGNVSAYSGQNGGIAYKVEAGGVVDSCVNDTVLTSAKSVLGGITAYNYGRIVNCENRGALNGYSTVGGIVGMSYGADTIVNCHNYGAITATSNYVGGILGTNSTAKALVPTIITDCHNEAEISAKSYVGGVIGRLYAGYDITNCYNKGLVSSSSSNAGGFIGQGYSTDGYTSHITNCHNEGDVVSKGNYSGGFAGTLSSDQLKVNNCYNTGDVLVTGNYSAGFSGSFSGVAYNCYNAGNIEASGYGIGGFGGLGAGEVHGCFNLGNVTSTSGSNKNGVAGGLWGYGRPKIYDSYNMGTVTGPAYVGGLTGGAFSAITFKNCYNAGEVACADSVNRGSIAPTAADNSFAYVNVYYDTDVNPGVASATDEFLAKGVSTRTLTLTNLSDSSYNVITGMYPTLKYQAQNAVANWFAAVPVFAEGESAEHICSFFVIGTPDSTEWTASDNLWINGNEVHGTAVGEAWITKTYGKFTKTYKLYVEVPSGVQDIDTNAQIVRTEYYTVSGMMLGTERPTGTGVYVARDIYSNGAAQAHKLVVR